jgi:hypothetical protein
MDPGNESRPPPSDVERATQVIAAEAPRRLRLEELLHELESHHPSRTKPSDPDAAPGEDGDSQPDAFTVGELVELAAEGGFGFLIGILSLIAIPFFGLSTPFGLAIALVGAQMMIGRRTPWLPARARRRRLGLDKLNRVRELLARRTRWLARSTRRRWEPMIRTRLVGLGVVLLALALALPLPIPGSNMVFLIPLLVYAIGLLERDGLWIAIGHVFALLDVALLVAFSATVFRVLERIWSWVS